MLFFLTAHNHFFIPWQFKEYVLLHPDILTCQAQAPVALCCLIHAQSSAARELFCHLYVESSFCMQAVCFLLWGANQSLPCTGCVLPPAGVHHTQLRFNSQNKVAENRLFQFIQIEIWWICISSQNNPEI